MNKLAIVGSGIAGLGAAYYLSDHYDIYLFEKNDYAGGHARTTFVEEQGRQLALDTGFLVYNETTYPNLTRLFKELGVATKRSNMSFSFHNFDNGIQFSGKSLQHLFARKIQFFSLPYLHFLLQALYFNRSAFRDISRSISELTLGEYLRQRGYNSYFIQNYIIPMGSAIWSIPFREMLDFPARAFIRFFYNHGFLGFNTGLEWRTIENGSVSYTQRIISKLGRGVLIGEAVGRVERKKGGVVIYTDRGEYQFDKALLATHADSSLEILARPTPLERELLSLYKYQKNIAVLHTDREMLSSLRSLWSSWNYKLCRRNGQIRTATVYYLNSLQDLVADRDYFVSINEFEDIDPDKIIEVIEYEHPLFDRKAIDSQKRLQKLNQGPIYFAGSYFRYGFHEDALCSGLQVVRRLLDGFKLLPV